MFYGGFIRYEWWDEKLEFHNKMNKVSISLYQFPFALFPCSWSDFQMYFSFFSLSAPPKPRIFSISFHFQCQQHSRPPSSIPIRPIEYLHRPEWYRPAGIHIWQVSYRPALSLIKLPKNLLFISSRNIWHFQPFFMFHPELRLISPVRIFHSLEDNSHMLLSTRLVSFHYFKPFCNEWNWS